MGYHPNVYQTYFWLMVIFKFPIKCMHSQETVGSMAGSGGARNFLLRVRSLQKKKTVNWSEFSKKKKKLIDKKKEPKLLSFYKKIIEYKGYTKNNDYKKNREEKKNKEK